jgi:pantoate--beta-alanine ligase
MTELVRTVAELRQAIARRRIVGSQIGFVPTMGALHEGHVSLMRRSVGECDATVVSVFVNPLQFGPREDLSAYPRDLDRDVALTEAAGVGLVFAPPVEEMYPVPLLTTVAVREVSEAFEGESRPTHFAGVTTVVAKLFNLVGPCRAYFGEKDWQQLAVVRRMVDDLSFDVEVIGCETVREADGLALSSRNAYLGRAERAAAPVLHRALVVGAQTIAAGERDPDRVVTMMSEMIDAESLASLDYVAVVDAASLSAVAPLTGELRLLGAARFGKARLIDNVGVTVG